MDLGDENFSASRDLLGDEHPDVLSKKIRHVVEKFRLYLSNSGDSYKSTTKKLDVLEGKLRFLHLDVLRRVKPHKEEVAAAWLLRLKKATNDAKGLLDDIEYEVKLCDSPIPAAMTRLFSDNRSLIRMLYVIGKLASVCSEGESIVDAPSLNENALEDKKNDKTFLSRVSMSGQTKLLLDDDFLVGRDDEIAMIRDMVLDNAQYVAASTSLEVREEADKLQIPQKGWITESLQKIDLSKRTQQATEVSPYPKNELGNKVYYIRLPHNSTVTYLQNPAVIPIVGISGVGKSALAQFIFNDANVRVHFCKSAWVYMTGRISQVDMIKQIINSFSPQSAFGNTTILKDAHSRLQSIIEGKRFLLVLDDAWGEICDIWDDIRTVLSKGAPGSVVLVTTQLYHVVSCVGTAGPVILDPLQSDDSWELLKRYAFADPNSSLSREGLQAIGRKIAHILPGLPLAVKILGATLGSKSEEAHWGRLLNSWWWNISDDNFETRVISSIGSCYSELPGYLRQCFVYCSIFPRNYVFEKDKLVQMWIANGFVQLNSSTGITRLEDIAGEWFDELVNRVFLEPSTLRTGYIMHDLVWDFSSALFSDEYHGIDSPKLSVSQHVHYLSIDTKGLNRLQDSFNIEQLRTLLLIGDTGQPSSSKSHLPIGGILGRSVSLRLLAFSSYSLGAEIPDDMSALKHLRYLDLSFTGINTLPSSICSLLLLQVIDLRGCTLSMVPENMNSLINLRHLHASSDTISQINGVGKLTKLQELHEFRVKAEDGHRISELRDLNDIRGTLLISEFEMVDSPDEAIEANIIEKHYLTTLELSWSYHLPEALAPDLSKAILEGLSPPRYLQKLKLHGYIGFAFPDWVGQLKYVRVVEISTCKNLKALPPLAQFEHLQKLDLNRLPLIKYINFEAYGTPNVVFRSLEELSFERMDEWESWTYAGGREIFPNLQKLRVNYCHKLKELPFESLGSTTKEIYIGFCGLNYDTVSQYLHRLTALARFEAYGFLYYSGKLILPCRQLRSLQYLKIDGFREVCIKGEFLDMRNLRELWIRSRKVTAELDKDLPLAGKHGSTERDLVMHSLTHLSLNSRSTQTVVRNIFHKTPSLRTLHLEGIDEPTDINEMWLEQLTSLQELEIEQCEALPLSLAALSSLKKLTLNYCTEIHSILPNVLPGNMKELQIKGCSLELVSRCQNPNGEVWLPKEDEMNWWRMGKLDKWRSDKIEYGLMKLNEMQQKKCAQERLMQKREKGFWNMEEPLKSTGEESLQRGQYMWPGKREQQLEERLFSTEEGQSNVDEQLNKEKEESLEKWLPQSVRDEWPANEWKGESWLLKKLDEVLIRNEEGPSSLTKEREEWMKEEEHRFRESLGKDWPSIAHIPYIRVNEQIVQNLYT